jgi:hypothetical protein
MPTQPLHHSPNSTLDLNLETSKNLVWRLAGIPNDKQNAFFRYAKGKFGVIRCQDLGNRLWLA